jgi:hypothetical protein
MRVSPSLRHEHLLALNASEPARRFPQACHDIVETSAERVACRPKLLHIVEHRIGGLSPDSRREGTAPQLLHVVLVGSDATKHGLDLREQIKAVDLHGFGMVAVEPFWVGRVLHDIARVRCSRVIQQADGPADR